MTWYDELDKWTADYLPDMPYEREVPLSRYTSFRIGGPARRMAFPQNGEQLILLLSRARELSARPIILGNGTNLLFPDAGVDRHPGYEPGGARRKRPLLSPRRCRRVPGPCGHDRLQAGAHRSGVCPRHSRQRGRRGVHERRRLRR